MSYVDGFLVAVPTANRDAYVAHAEAALPLFKSFGVAAMVEGWGEDVPRGTVNDLYGAVQATDDETVVFSWVEYPDRATRDSAGERMMTDPAMAAMGEMPFDGKRMVHGGFRVVHDTGAVSGTGYIDGCVLPLGIDRFDDYAAYARRCAPMFLDAGALRVVDAVGDDVRDGQHTDFHRAVLREDGETAAFGWIEWPSREARDAGWQRAMADPRMPGPGEGPFDGRRMMFGGFVPVVYG